MKQKDEPPKREQEVEEKQQALQVPKILKSEVNLLVFPFFALSGNDARNRTKTEYRALVERENGILEILWRVTSNSEYGYPGPFDRAVHKAIEEIISELEPPIKNPIPFSIYDLCRRVGVDTGGAQYRKVKEALERIKFTGIKSQGTFYSKAKEEWIDDVFTLYERIIFQGSKMPDGRIAERNYLFLNSWYLENLNLFYIKPLDYGYYKSLSSALAQRLYELLGVKFYYILKENLPCLRYRYSTICQLLPLVRHQYESYVERQIGPAHQELIKTGFLERVEMEEIWESEKDWFILYYPGPKAKEEISRVREQLERSLKKTEAIPSSPAEEIHKPADRKEEAEIQGIVNEMIEVLGDASSRPFYTKVARLCPKGLIYRILSEVKDEARRGLIRTKKGAVFTDKLKRACKEKGIELGLKSD